MGADHPRPQAGRGQPRRDARDAWHRGDEHRRLPHRAHGRGLPDRRALPRPRITASQRGRWPANLVLSHGAGCTDEQCEADCPIGLLGERHRFFFCAKAPRRERGPLQKLPRQVVQTPKFGAHNEQCRSEPSRQRPPDGQADRAHALAHAARHLGPRLVLDPSRGPAAPASRPASGRPLPQDRARSRLRPIAAPGSRTGRARRPPCRASRSARVRTSTLDHPDIGMIRPPHRRILLRGRSPTASRASSTPATTVRSEARSSTAPIQIYAHSA